MLSQPMGGFAFIIFLNFLQECSCFLQPLQMWRWCFHLELGWKCDREGKPWQPLSSCQRSLGTPHRGCWETWTVTPKMTWPSATDSWCKTKAMLRNCLLLGQAVSHKMRRWNCKIHSILKKNCGKICVSCLIVPSILRDQFNFQDCP